MIMAKKAEIQAKLAARAAGQAPPAAGSAPSAGPAAGLPVRPPPASAAAPGAPLDPTSLAAKVAAARARLLATTAAMGMSAHAPPAVAAPTATASSSARPGALGGGVKKERNDEMPRGGLTMGIHPSLLEPASAVSALAKDKGRATMAPKFTSLKVRPASLDSVDRKLTTFSYYLVGRLTRAMRVARLARPVSLRPPGARRRRRPSTRTSQRPRLPKTRSRARSARPATSSLFRKAATSSSATRCGPTRAWRRSRRASPRARARPGWTPSLTRSRSSSSESRRRRSNGGTSSCSAPSRTTCSPRARVRSITPRGRSPTLSSTRFRSCRRGRSVRSSPRRSNSPRRSVPNDSSFAWQLSRLTIA